MKIFNSFPKRGRWVVGIVLGLLATVLLLGLEAHFRPFARDGLYFQAWSSETMMQTVSIEDLRDEPLRTLWYLHIQPPAYDAIRALIAHFYWSDDSMTMLRGGGPHDLHPLGSTLWHDRLRCLLVALRNNQH